MLHTHAHLAAPEPASRKHLPPGLHQAEGPGKRPPGDLVNAVPLYLEPQESPLPSYLLTPPLGSQLSGSRLLRGLLPLTLSAQNRAGWTSPLRRRWRRRQGARAAGRHPLGALQNLRAVRWGPAHRRRPQRAREPEWRGRGCG